MSETRTTMILKVGSKQRDGFTILEVMIALTASLLLLLSLTKAFKLIGDQITESQAEVELSSTLRDSTFRLREELRRATAEMVPAFNGTHEPLTTQGYLTYHEGPFTDLTTVLGDIPTVGADRNYFPQSRYGDIDDFLAFTARSEKGSPFVGVIPWGVLEAKRLVEVRKAGGTYVLPAGYDPTRQVPFSSTLAEVVYWISPEWQRKADGTLVYDAANGYPLFVDVDNDLLPDRLNLHRRVLLIRGDLSIAPSEAGLSGSGVDDVPQILYVYDGGGGTPAIEPLAYAGGGGVSRGYSRLFWTASDQMAIPGDPRLGRSGVSPAWMTGLAQLQQVMDLSLSRIENSTGAVASYQYGQPTHFVRANTLADVSKPENRFGAVRMPIDLADAGDQQTYMPLLALCPPHPYLAQDNRESIFPSQAYPAATASPGPGTNNQFRYGRLTMKTYLRPEFNLADAVHDDPSHIPSVASTTPAVRIGRAGDDIVARDVLSFDVRIFDPEAPIYTGVGADGLPGSGSTDDDGDSVTDGITELGWVDTDDIRVGVTDPLIRDVLETASTNSGGGAIIFEQTDEGDFVDLNYARLAGGPVMGAYFDASRNGNSVTPNAARTLDLVTPYSGIEVAAGGSAPSDWLFPESFLMSGRAVTGRTTLRAAFFQSTFDTWSNHYARDTYDQEGQDITLGGALGLAYQMSYGPYRTSLQNGGSVRGEPLASRAWTSTTLRSNYRPFASVPYVEYRGGSVTSPTLRTDTTSVVSDSPLDVSAPFADPLEALSISIRVYNPSAGQLRQQTIVEYFQ
ncbi:hypothetical protein [Rhodopirellula sp. P2]|uniref:hypothetical protein n=1 Tax=Rhodopirellula sp. P2 TaxID=2127060 RepID=UPI0023684DF0|nr:hypothetical protein [Rhodopirellula sp. P2]WDQ16564.1 hypothetical protein PSR62_23530 [Rhodopirellula sp. P2]